MFPEITRLWQVLFTVTEKEKQLSTSVYQAPESYAAPSKIFLKRQILENLQIKLNKQHLKLPQQVNL